MSLRILPARGTGNTLHTFSLTVNQRLIRLTNIESCFTVCGDLNSEVAPVVSPPPCPSI